MDDRIVEFQKCVLTGSGVSVEKGGSSMIPVGILQSSYFEKQNVSLLS
jgi:hypothetical protein